MTHFRIAGSMFQLEVDVMDTKPTNLGEKVLEKVEGTGSQYT